MNSLPMGQELWYLLSCKPEAKLLNKQSSCRWFEPPWCSCDVTAMLCMNSVPDKHTFIVCCRWTTSSYDFFFIPDAVFNQGRYFAPPIRQQETVEKWGYVDVRKDAHMFWWLYHTTAAEGYTNKPLVIWLQVKWNRLDKMQIWISGLPRK